MKFTFWPTDLDFEKNIMYIRKLTLRNPVKYVNVVRDGQANDCLSCHIRPDGWFAYTLTDFREVRCDMGEINKVEIAL